MKIHFLTMKKMKNSHPQVQQVQHVQQVQPVGQEPRAPDLHLFLYSDIVFSHQSLKIWPLHPYVFGRFGDVPVVSGQGIQNE